MGFGSRRSLIRPRRSPAPAKPLGETRKFFSDLGHIPRELGIGRKPVVKAAPPSRGKPLVQPTELTPADESGVEFSADAKPGDTVSIRGRPAVVRGHSRRGALLVTPGSDITVGRRDDA